ncbi:capsular polysaccharide export protein, LipB/KpsS family [Paraburkholderia oxyphila]|uniref:capsular polysaccharide export protein, LipB/KpsS family n=1 Tax=Paraburkholderia oxyphila TaxID=614212 RepID=UPI000A519D1A|nr:capsular biosynthesis protein [Paraburkholderia oxyphila]
MRAFGAALNDALLALSTSPPAAGRDAALQHLMRRTVELAALDPAHHVPTCPAALCTHDASAMHVLLVDERAVVAEGGGTRTRRKTDFQAMVAAARCVHPDAIFWLGRSNGDGHGRWLSELTMSSATLPLRVLDPRDSLCAAIGQVDHVYTLSSPEGMHALLAGVPLHVFGTPWYAGWGLTHDVYDFVERTARPSLGDLFEVGFQRFACYLDPTTYTRGTLESFLDNVELQRAIARRYRDLDHVVGLRFQWWKRPFATPFLTAGGGTLRWHAEPASVRPGERAALWGARCDRGLPDGSAPFRIEDGFLHSCGLGSDMSRPHSQVIDLRGLYFDASSPNDLSTLLNEAVFSERELARAAALRAQIVACGLTKYNLGRRRPTWRAPAGKQVILVPGQVADDASIRLGTRRIAAVDALLREVRAARPDAFVIYKPHPDVLSGNRQGLVEIEHLADVVDTQADLISLIDVSHEVHTISSLSGFEALLRGKAVFTYGLPFYAGWGLTHDDLAPLPWRQRTLSLDMLTAGVLLRYPLYWDWRLRRFTTPERIVRELAPHAARPLARVRSDPLRGARKIFRWSRNAIEHIWWHTRQRALNHNEGNSRIVNAQSTS